MKKLIAITVIFIAFFSSSLSLLAGEKYIVDLRLLRGTWADEKGAPRAEVLLTTASTPRLLSLRDKMRKSSVEVQQTLVDCLIKCMNVATVEDLIAISRIISDDESGIMEKVLDSKKGLYYRAHIAIQAVSPDEVKIKLRLMKTYDIEVKGKTPSRTDILKVIQESDDESRMEKILDRELLMKIDDPVILAVPASAGAYFISVFPTKSIPSAESKKESSKPEPLNGAMKPTSQIMPAYPAELRKAGYGGEVRLEVLVDENGAVQEAKVVKSLHPYLDNAAVQALRQWKYEPALQNGKPVAVKFDVVISFNPDAGDALERESRMARGEPSYPEPLGTILKEGAAYCRKMSGAILDFVCQETINETHYFLGDDKWALMAGMDRAGNIVEDRVLLSDSRKTIRKVYVCDYMLIRKEDAVEEQRTILKEDGRQPADPKKFLNEKRYKVLAPLFISLRILDADRQWQYSFRLVDQARTLGKKAYVIEALPISGNASGVEYAKIWMDLKDLHILKCEIQGVPLEGYEDVLAESADLNIKPAFTATHEYEMEKNGIYFPSRSEIRVNYNYEVEGPPKKMVKMKTDFKYDQYKFFTVMTDTRIIK